MHSLCGWRHKDRSIFFLPQRVEAVYTESHWGVRICQGDKGHELLSLPKAVAVTVVVAKGLRSQQWLCCVLHLILCCQLACTGPGLSAVIQCSIR